MALACEIQLNRKDLHQVGLITGRSLALLPPSDKKKCCKVVIGCDNGKLHCFRIKKGEMMEEFDTPNLDYPVTRVFVGGPSDKRDKIFFTSGQIIRGVNKKGKEFLRFNTDSAESLKGLWVDDTKIWTTGEYMFNYYEDTKDKGYFMAKDKINDLLVMPVLGVTSFNPILACHDRYVRLLEGSTLAYEAFVDGAAQSLSRFSSKKLADVVSGRSAKEIIYGTDNGIVGQLFLESAAMKTGWVVPNLRGLGGITNMLTHDLTRNGIHDIVLARDDGELQVLAMDHTGEPTQIFSKSVNECIEGLELGRVTTASFDEVVLATYSGKVLSFTTESLGDHHMHLNSFSSQSFPASSGMVEKVLAEGVAAVPEEKAQGEEKKKKGLASLFGLGRKKDKEEPKPPKSKLIAGLVLDEPAAAAPEPPVVAGADEDVRTDPKEREKKIKALRAEIETLRVKVKEQKGMFERLTPSSVPVSTRSRAKSTMILDVDKACYRLTLECEMPIDMLAIQSSLPLVLLDPGASVPSESGPDQENGNLFLATLRVQGTTNRLQVQIMVKEGMAGPVNSFVITRTPPKVCHLVENQMKPLSLHTPVKVDETPDKGGVPVSEIRMTGSFGLGQMHAWVAAVFPSVPAKVPESDSVRYSFESAFLGTRISVEYSKGEAVLRSSNLSTLAVAKDAISREVGRLGGKLDVKAPVINEACVLYMLQVLHPKLEKLLELKNRVRFLDALAEMGAQEGAADFLEPRLRDTLRDADQVRAEHRDNAKKIDFIEHILEQLFIDRFKFRGINVKHRLAEVHALVTNYSWEGLVTLFAAA